MKKCPACNRIYDNSQVFCLEDGTPLATDSPTDSQKTLVLPRKKNRFPLILGGLLLLVGVLIGGMFLFSSGANNVNQNNRQAAVSIQTPVSTSTPTPIVQTPTPLSSPSPTPTVSPEANSNVSANSETKPETIANSKPADESDSAKQLPIIMKSEDHSVLFALHECRKSGSSITCIFSLTNKGQDRRFQLSIYKSKLFDESGNGYTGSHAQLANKTGDFPAIDFVSGVTTRAQMTFDKVEPNTTKITLLNLGFIIGSDYDLSVKFRNVPLIVSK